MLEIINWKGYFYTPGTPSDKLPGILTFSQEDGIHVELFDQFKEYKSPTSREENILLGFTSNGKRVTLLNCYENRRGMNAPGFATSDFSARYLLVGRHFERPADILFDDCTIEYRDINYWLNISGFDKPSYSEEKKETIIRYVQPNKLFFPIKPDWTLEIEFQYRRPLEYFVPVSQVSISQEPAVILRPSKKKHLHDFEEVYGTFNSFLAMGYYTYPIIEVITFSFRNAAAENDEYISEKVTLYYSSGLSYIKYKEHKNRTDFLFRYSTYANQFDSIIIKWFDLKKQIDVSIDVLTECFMDRGNTIESNFTSLTQALENMHRKLNSGNITLRQRLDAIVNGMPERAKLAILNTERDFAIRITNNRNYYTHYTVRGDFIPASLTELWVLSEKLKLILLITTLKAVGFTDEQVESMIFKKGMYLFNHIINTSGMGDYLREISSLPE